MPITPIQASIAQSACRERAAKRDTLVVVPIVAMLFEAPIIRVVSKVVSRVVVRKAYIDDNNRVAQRFSVVASSRTTDRAATYGGSPRIVR